MNRKQWRLHDEKRRQEGLSVRAYCTKTGISMSSWKYHKRREESSFVEVEILDNKPAESFDTVRQRSIITMASD